MQLNQIDLDTLCPACGQLNKVALHPRSSMPKAGDFAICLHCREVARYHMTVFGISLRVLSADEKEMVKTQPQLRGVRKLLAAYDTSRRES